MWMLFLSCISASSGSTGGGIKMIRTLILFKQAGREFVKLLHPAAVNPMKIGGHVVPNNIVFAVLGFIFLYFMTVATLAFALMASGLDFISSLSAIIACINNAGPGLGMVGPARNFSVLTDFPDLDMHSGDAGRPPGNFYPADYFYAAFLAAIIGRSWEPVQDDIDQELLPLFLEEADELYPQIGNTLQAWREQSADALLARKLQRSLHTLKGSARMAGAMRVGELVHRMEEQAAATGTQRSKRSGMSCKASSRKSAR